MRNKTVYWVLLCVLLLPMLAGCGGSQTADEETEASVPTELNIAVVHEFTVEQGWSLELMQAIDQIAAENPHGLTINVDYTENVGLSDAENVFREYAETGKYDVIWAHSGYSDQVANVYEDYPEILWVLAGPGNVPLGDNVYWVYVHMHEQGYILGTLAGMLTESNVLGLVAAYPFPDPADVLNGFIEGARSVNPDIEARVTYIESWYDPPLAREAAQAQIASGADIIFAERYGPFEACEEEGLYCFGQYIDYYDTHPESFVTGTQLSWNPLVRYILDEYWAHVSEGVPYDGQTDEPYWLSMADGGGDVFPLRDWVNELPDDVVARFDETRDAVLDGSLVVPLNEEAP